MPDDTDHDDLFEDGDLFEGTGLEEEAHDQSAHDHDALVGGIGTPESVEEEPSSYHSGRVRIIGVEPAGDSVREVTGPVADEHPELQHWNDAPTGQVPAVLDRSGGDESGMAPPTWREESTDWEAHEESFEPAMLSDDQPAVGALAEERDEIDVERQPWHFESEDTLVLEPEVEAVSELEGEPDFAPGPEFGRVPPFAGPPVRPIDPEPVLPVEPEPLEDPTRLVGQATAGATVVEASRPGVPEPPGPRARAARSRNGASARAGSPRAGAPRVVSGRAATVGSAGTGGRDMRVAVGTGVVLGIVVLACFAAGTVASMVVVCIVVLLATAEAYAAFRRAHYHPATLLGLVAVLSLLVETYNKGVAALPLVLVLLVAGSFVWYLARVEPAAEPVSGITSTVFVFVWVGVFGSFAALLLNPNLFPNRHGIAFLLAAVVVTVADDVASLLVGSAMGRHQLAPSISPNKSWEGLIGGAVAAVLVAVVVVHFIHPWTIGKAALYGLVVAVVAPLGDLSQSMIKRNLGLKDMGRVLPGHGGILDRVDGLLFVIPATYFVVKALHLG